MCADVRARVHELIVVCVRVCVCVCVFPQVERRRLPPHDDWDYVPPPADVCDYEHGDGQWQYFPEAYVQRHGDDDDYIVHEPTAASSGAAPPSQTEASSFSGSAPASSTTAGSRYDIAARPSDSRPQWFAGTDHESDEEMSGTRPQVPDTDPSGSDTEDSDLEPPPKRFRLRGKQRPPPCYDRGSQ